MPIPLYHLDPIRTEVPMKDGIHPEYREVVFQDVSANFAFLTRSTIKTKDTIKWEDGKTYPLVRLDISSASHPFFTGKMKYVDSAGQIERFKKKFGGNYGQKKEAPKPLAESKPAEEAK
jgi:large subunit ribosomal protein L31